MGKFIRENFRGEAGVCPTSEDAYRLGRAAGRVLGVGAPCRAVIGKDTRRSSYMLEYALCAGLIASGADAYIMHVTTNPSIVYTVTTDGFDLGITVSGGSAPWYENGIKLTGRDGERLPDGVIDEIEDCAYGKRALPFASGSAVGRTVDYVSGRNRYIGRLIGLAGCSFKRLRIGIDAANGSAWRIADSVFSALGAKTYMLGNTPDGVNVNRGAGPDYTEKLSELVKREELDIGFSFDCGAERCVAVNERGEIMDDGNVRTVCGFFADRMSENFNGRDGLVDAIRVAEALVEMKCRASLLASYCN